MASQATAELPKLPELPYLVSRQSYAMHEVISYARVHGAACFEAGRASRAQTEPLTDWPIHGIRVAQGTVVIVAKGNVKSADEAARWMCGALLAMKNGETK
jgi:hypothetical protein